MLLRIFAEKVQVTSRSFSYKTAITSAHLHASQKMFPAASPTVSNEMEEWRLLEQLRGL